MSLGQELRSIPNLLSILRLFMVPLFLWLLLVDQFVWALVVMGIASASDWFDGFIARRFNQITQLGQVLDPAADRMFIFATLVGLTVNGNIPAWLAIVIVARDVMLLAVYPVLATHGHGPLPVHFLGKAGTFALLYALPLLLMSDIWPAAEWLVLPLAWAFAYWGIGMYWLSGFIYLKQVKDLVASAK